MHGPPPGTSYKPRDKPKFNKGVGLVSSGNRHVENPGGLDYTSSSISTISGSYKSGSIKLDSRDYGKVVPKRYDSRPMKGEVHLGSMSIGSLGKDFVKDLGHLSMGRKSRIDLAWE